MKTKKQSQSFWKEVDLLAMIGMPILATVVSLFFKTNLLISTLLFYGLPSLYFSYRTPKGVVRALLFSLVVAIFGFLIIDYVGTLDLSWFVPTIFSFRPMGMTVEELVWGFQCAYVVVIIYEHFLDKGSHKSVGRNFKYFFALAMLLFMIFMWAYLNRPELLYFQYAYLKIGLVFFVMPFLIMLVFYSRFAAKFAKIGAYFFVINLLHELTALQLNQWSFPGKNLIGWVSIVNYRFPLEEFVFFVILAPIALLCYFEYFDDNRLK